MSLMVAAVERPDCEPARSAFLALSSKRIGSSQRGVTGDFTATSITSAPTAIAPITAVSIGPIRLQPGGQPASSFCCSAAREPLEASASAAAALARALRNRRCLILRRHPSVPLAPRRGRVKGATLKVYPGAPHGLFATHREQVPRGSVGVHPELGAPPASKAMSLPQGYNDGLQRPLWGRAPASSDWRRGSASKAAAAASAAPRWCGSPRTTPWSSPSSAD